MSGITSCDNFCNAGTDIISSSCFERLLALKNIFVTFVNSPHKGRSDLSDSHVSLSRLSVIKWNPSLYKPIRTVSTSILWDVASWVFILNCNKMFLKGPCAGSTLLLAALGNSDMGPVTSRPTRPDRSRDLF